MDRVSSVSVKMPTINYDMFVSALLRKVLLYK